MNASTTSAAMTMSSYGVTTFAEVLAGLEPSLSLDEAKSIDGSLNISPVTLSSDWSRVVRLLMLASLAVVGSVGNVFMISAVMVEDHLKKRGLFLARPWPSSLSPWHHLLSPAPPQQPPFHLSTLSQEESGKYPRTIHERYSLARLLGAKILPKEFRTLRFYRPNLPSIMFSFLSLSLSLSLPFIYLKMIF
jgi:hypothetical protein